MKVNLYTFFENAFTELKKKFKDYYSMKNILLNIRMLKNELIIFTSKRRTNIIFSFSKVYSANNVSL